jgi:hypothetical protein
MWILMSDDSRSSMCHVSEARSIMGDEITDGGLIDMTGIDLAELSSMVREPGLALALERILTSGEDAKSYGFSSRI